MKRLFFSILFAVMMLPVMAQSARDLVRLGNAAYRAKLYDQAETMYLKSIAKHPSFEAYYNLGNAYVMQRKDSVAFENFKKADSVGTSDPMRKALNFHNMGNIWYAQGLAAYKQQAGNPAGCFQNAVNFYKSSLRCNPDDNETRYNLAMAQYMLKKTQNQDQNGGGDDKEQEDKKNQQKQNQEKQEKEDQKQNEQQQPEPKKDDMSDQAAEQLLQSAQQDEKSVQRKVNQNPNNRRRSLEKDW